MSILHFFRSLFAGAMLFIRGLLLVLGAGKLARDNQKIWEEELKQAERQSQDGVKFAQAKVVFCRAFLAGHMGDKGMAFIIGSVVMLGGVVVFTRYMIG